MSHSFSGILSATLGSLPSEDPWPSDSADSGSSVVISSCPQLHSAALKELPLPSSAWSGQSGAQPLSIFDISLSGLPALTCGSVSTAGCPSLSSSSPSPPQPLCSLWLKKQSLWQVKEVPALPGGGPAGLHLIMAAPPHPSPLSLLL